MTRVNAIVKLPTGLHARPAAEVVKLAGTYECDIVLEHQGKRVNAKDLWEVLSSNIEYNDEIIIECNGNNEEAASKEMAGLITMVGVDNGL